MLRWVNTKTVPVLIEVEQIDVGYLYRGQLLDVETFVSYDAAIVYKIKQLETQLIILKSEQKRNQLVIEATYE